MRETTRAELSEKSKYWIDRHRYYELKHFCLQYPLWKKIYMSLGGIAAQRAPDPTGVKATGTISDPTAKSAEELAYLFDRMRLVESAAMEADDFLWPHILKGVTEGRSYDVLNVNDPVPCCKDIYYDRYRKFFWLLDRKRQ
jgi:hypothetical protein